jgi:FdhE protein
MTDMQGRAKASSLALALAAMAKENPVHAGLIRSLGKLVLARAELAESLPTPDPAPFMETDRARFLQGGPLLPLARLPLELPWLSACAKGLTQVLTETFPKLAPAVSGLDQAFVSGRMHLKARMAGFLVKGVPPPATVLARVGSSPEAAALYLGQIIKTLAQAVSAKVLAQADLDGWTKGYCPVCGSPPELSYLEGKEGRRRLACSLCEATWRFTRVACPCCGCDDPEKIELIHVDGRLTERAEACRECHRYVLGVDRRDSVREMIPALEPLGLLHLDVIAQERRYSPVSAEAAVLG